MEMCLPGREWGRRGCEWNPRVSSCRERVGKWPSSEGSCLGPGWKVHGDGRYWELGRTQRAARGLGP